MLYDLAITEDHAWLQQSSMASRAICRRRATTRTTPKQVGLPVIYPARPLVAAAPSTKFRLSRRLARQKKNI